MNNLTPVYIEELRHAVAVASLNYDIWWVYKSADTRPKYVDTMNKFSPHFSTAIHAHFIAILVYLYRLYETRDDTYNIPQTINIFSESKKLTEADAEILRNKYFERAKPLWIKINILRNKVFGHRATSHTIEQAFQEADVNADQIKELIEISKSLVIEISSKLEMFTCDFELEGREATIKLLESLRSN